MKCRNCKYLKIIFHECDLFGDNMPIEFKDEKGGCLLHYKEKEKLKKLDLLITLKCVNGEDLDLNDLREYLTHLKEKYGKKEANNNSNGNNI